MKYIILLLLFFLTSCVNYNERLYLNKDASGKIEIELEFGSFISSLANLDKDSDFAKDIKDDLENLPQGLRLETIKEFKRSSNRVVEIVCSFENINKIQNFNSSKNDVIFNFDEITFDGKNYKRIINLENTSKTDDDAPSFLKNMFDIEFNFQLYIENQFAIEWDYDLEDLLEEEELSMKFTQE